MRALSVFLLILLVAGGFVLSQSAFIVPVTHQAVVVRLGDPIREINEWGSDETGSEEAGLHWKVPFVDSVVLFDRRSLNFDVASQEIIAAGQERLVVDAFARYRITSPTRFYRAVRDISGGEQRLEPIMQSSLRGVLGSVGPDEVISGQRAQLMRAIRDLANRRASGVPEEELPDVVDGVEIDLEEAVVEEAAISEENLGIEIIDVRIRRADLPDANAERVLARMRTEREQAAQLIRAQGQERAVEIRANADREATVIRANAQRNALRIRGGGDGERNRIYAEAYNQDTEFFAFYRSMQAYEEAIQDDQTIILSPDSDFFSYFRDQGGLTDR